MVTEAALDEGVEEVEQGEEGEAGGDNAGDDVFEEVKAAVAAMARMMEPTQRRRRISAGSGSKRSSMGEASGLNWGLMASQSPGSRRLRRPMGNIMGRRGVDL
ncbi:MAG: hypothetical protein HS123_18380 [Solibacteraceae bacterium]|nr:hypothetical protein [Solibacteraceae bacterium]